MPPKRDWHVCADIHGTFSPSVEEEGVSDHFQNFIERIHLEKVAEA
jgi:hypothetical protein